MSTAARVFPWSEMYSVNIATLDRQHQELIDTVDELEQALRAGEGNGAINHVLEKLVDYATAHFADEESLMEKHDFPELPAHRSWRALVFPALQIRSRRRGLFHVLHHFGEIMLVDAGRRVDISGIAMRLAHAKFEAAAIVGIGRSFHEIF